jgi:predicted DNA-binding transcriptional regulator AlpA
MPQRTSADSSDVILETRDLADRLTGPSGTGPSPRTLERWRTTGAGPRFIKLGHRVAYRQSDVERWLDERTRTHTHDTGSRRKAR